MAKRRKKITGTASLMLNVQQQRCLKIRTDMKMLLNLEAGTEHLHFQLPNIHGKVRVEPMAQLLNLKYNIPINSDRFRVFCFQYFKKSLSFLFRKLF